MAEKFGFTMQMILNTEKNAIAQNTLSKDEGQCCSFLLKVRVM